MDIYPKAPPGCLQRAAHGSAIPGASVSEIKSGWAVQFGLLQAIADDVNRNEESNVSLEDVDDIIQVLQARGYAVISPNDQAQRPGSPDTGQT